jgi:hypothetical protein
MQGSWIEFGGRWLSGLGLGQGSQSRMSGEEQVRAGGPELGVYVVHGCAPSFLKPAPNPLCAVFGTDHTDLAAAEQIVEHSVVPIEDHAVSASFSA